jgi:cytochrome c biogenesis protein CcmG/thiol:disulfide interchange protein DsbE
MSVETPIEPDNARPGKMRIVFALLPLLIFAGLAAIFWSQLDSGRDISEIPSALIGTKAPSLDLPPLEGATFKGAAMPGLNDAAIKGKLTLVNVWASWCLPCREENPIILELAKDPRLTVVGINYKDQTVPGRTRQSVLRRRHRSARQGGNRLGRLWYPGILPRRCAGDHRLQAGRTV